MKSLQSAFEKRLFEFLVLGIMGYAGLTLNSQLSTLNQSVKNIYQNVGEINVGLAKQGEKLEAVIFQAMEQKGMSTSNTLAIQDNTKKLIEHDYRILNIETDNGNKTTVIYRGKPEEKK